MPTCVDCDTWRPPSEGLTRCPACGGALLSREELLERRAAVRGISTEDYRRQRSDEREAALQARHEADAARSAAETAAAAAAAGQTVEEYQESMRRVLAQAEQGRGCTFGVILVSLPVSLAVGAVLVVGALLLGGPFLAVIGGAVVGLVAGLGLGLALYVILPVGGHPRLHDTVMLVVWALPPLMVALCSMAAAALAN